MFIKEFLCIVIELEVLFSDLIIKKKALKVSIINTISFTFKYYFPSWSVSGDWI